MAQVKKNYEDQAVRSGIVQTPQTQQQTQPAQQVQQTAQTPQYNYQAQQTQKGLQGVSDSTAAQMQKYQNGYQQSDTVTAAQQTLQQLQGMKPQGYDSKYGDALEGILQQIQNPQQFKYEFNGDNLFKGYADLYTQKGKQASMDAMGQAAALTGGYGNSYAQQAGMQGYQQYLLGLYDKGLDLYDRAYQGYRDRLGDQYNQYNLLAAADQTGYDRYRDMYNDWMQQEQQAYDRSQDAQNFDYNQYMQDRDYWTKLAQIENADYRTEQERQEAIRQFELEFGEKQRQYDTSMAENQRQYDTSMAENKRQYDTSMEENRRQYDTSLAENQRQYDQDYTEKVRQYNENMAENQRQYDTSMAENQRQYDTSMAEKQRQYDQDYAEDVRRYNQDFTENQRRYDQEFEAETERDARDYAEKQRQFNETLQFQRDQFEYDKMTDAQRYAFDICSTILANGNMPSAELLKAAGISEQDARGMMAQLQVVVAGGGSNGGPKPNPNPNPNPEGEGRKLTRDYNGNYWYRDPKTGKEVKVPASEVTKKDTVDDSQYRYAKGDTTAKVDPTSASVHNMLASNRNDLSKYISTYEASDDMSTWPKISYTTNNNVVTGEKDVNFVKKSNAQKELLPGVTSAQLSKDLEAWKKKNGGK